MQKNIVIYTKNYCPYCTRAKNFFKAKDLIYQEIDVTENTDLQVEMMAKAQGRKTVPQIFIGNHHVGGWDDLHALHTNGQFEALLS